MSRLSFILEIDNYKKHLRDVLKNHADGDLHLLLKSLENQSGDEAFVNVAGTFLKTQILFPEKPFNELKKIYLYQNKNMPVGKLARKLDVDIRTIYIWLAEMGIKRNGSSESNPGFFDEED